MMLIRPSNVAKPRNPEHLTTGVLRVRLPAVRRQVQFKGEILPVYNYGILVGWLMPLVVAESLDLKATEDRRLSQFRDQLTELHERLQIDLDAVWITNHDRRVMAFVSPNKYVQEAKP